MGGGPTIPMSDIYTPKYTIHMEYEGQSVMLEAGKTRVRKGHPIMKNQEDAFEVVSDHVDYDTEKTSRRK